MKQTSQILRNVTSSWGLLAINSAIQLVQIPIALEALGKAEFGLFAIVSQMLGMLMYVEMGVSGALARLLIDGLAQGHERYRAVWSSGVVLLLVQSLIILGLVSAFVPFIDKIFNIPPELSLTARHLFLACGVLTAIRYFFNLFNLSLFVNQRLSISNGLGIIGCVLGFGIFVVAIKLGFGLWAYFWSMALGSAFGIIASFLVCYKHSLAPKFGWSLIQLNEVKEIFHLGLDVFFITLFSTFTMNSPLLFAGNILTLSETAALAVNLKLFGMAHQLFGRIYSGTEPVLMKMVSQGDFAGMRFWWNLAAKSAMTCAIFAGGCLFLGAPLVVGWWTSPNMVLPWAAGIFFCLMPLRFMMHLVLVSSLVIFKGIRHVRFSLVWEAFVYSCLILLLGKHFGVTGLLAGIILSFPLGAVWRGAAWLAKLSQYPPAELAKTIARTLVPPLSALGCIILISREEMLGRLPYVVGMSILWCAINGIAFYGIALTKSERSAIASYLLRLLPKRQAAEG